MSIELNTEPNIALKAPLKTSMKILITGAAGFIGLYVAQKLLERGDEVIGIDNLNDYYAPQLKADRLDLLKAYANFRFIKMDIADHAALNALFAAEKFQRVVNLAAQAGVRYSITNPQVYIQSNLVGFANVLEACRQHSIEHLVYASSSSVYGANTKIPFATQDSTDHPVSLYAASKKSNELMAHSYSHLFGLPTTGLRYFTVYGPWGRPDMSVWLFSQAILSGKPIDVFNHGQMQRDFTYVEDIAEGTLRALDKTAAADLAFNPAAPDSSTSNAPYRIYNIGNHQPVALLTFIETLEAALGKTAQKNYLPMQPGDVLATYADVDALRRDVGFEPKTPLAEGLSAWAKWFSNNYAKYDV